MDTVATPLILGVDLGRLADHSALVLAECGERPTGRTMTEYRPPVNIIPAEHVTVDETETVYRVRAIKRLELGVQWSHVIGEIVNVVTMAIERIAQADERTHWPDTQARGFAHQAYQSARGNVWLLYDRTGIGDAIGEPLERALQDVGGVLTPCVFTAGEKFVGSVGSESRVGKAYMVSRLQALIETGRIELPRTHEARVLADELLAYRVDPNPITGTDSFGAKVGAHDDLVVALGLATLLDPRRYRVWHSESPWT